MCRTKGLEKGHSAPFSNAAVAQRILQSLSFLHWKGIENHPGWVFRVAWLSFPRGANAVRPVARLTPCFEALQREPFISPPRSEVPAFSFERIQDRREDGHSDIAGRGEELPVQVHGVGRGGRGDADPGLVPLSMAT